MHRQTIEIDGASDIEDKIRIRLIAGGAVRIHDQDRVAGKPSTALQPR